MYVTGGIGGNYSGEAFSYDYHLPNELAYTETCASIAMAFFCQRMYLLTGEKKYIDIIELQIYNGILSGISLYGDRFFHCNPLEVHPERRDYFTKIRNGQFAPEYERPEYFGCSCCPPNVIRFIASLGQYMYHTDGDKIYVNLYNSSEFSQNGVKIIQETDYPRSGEVKMKVSADKAAKIYLRMPDWCKSMRLKSSTGGEVIEAEEKIGGSPYLEIELRDNGKCECTIDFDMPVTELHANPKVHNNAGKIAVKRGPVVYCMESTDNEGDLNSARKIKIIGGYECEKSEIFGNPIVKITCVGEIITEDSENLYSETPFKTEQKKLTLIPYAAWANRGKSEMIVWIRK
jgi:DUF1680 family protein